MKPLGLFACLLALMIYGQMQSQRDVVYIPSWAGIWRVVGHKGQDVSEGWAVGSHSLALAGLSSQASLSKPGNFSVPIISGRLFPYKG